MKYSLNKQSVEQALLDINHLIACFVLLFGFYNRFFGLLEGTIFLAMA